MSAGKYDVFLSFRGSDTRTGFADFLYNSLKFAGVRVFRDNEELQVGRKIDTNIYQAIRNCKTAIPIISRQYAESKWCLKELAEIIDCHRNYGLSVFPIFYKVDVYDVCYQKGEFGKAFEELKKHYKLEVVQKWERALVSVTKIKGWISQTIANGHEGELVKVVVEKVSTAVKPTWTEWLFGISSLMDNYHARAVFHHLTDNSKSEVFLAFRCRDTGNGLAAYLYVSLLNEGIRVFSFDAPSLIGKAFDPEIRYAITHCRISIPILSANFSSSTWCLNELVQMTECKKKRIMPIFYKVKPSDVKDLKGSFGHNIHQHSKRTKYSQWKEAAMKVGTFKGWESEKIANGHEGHLVRKIVKEVKDLLKDTKPMNSPV